MICSSVSISEVNLWFIGRLVKVRWMFWFGVFRLKDGMWFWLLCRICSVILFDRFFRVCSRFSIFCDLVLLLVCVVIWIGWVMCFR